MLIRHSVATRTKVLSLQNLPGELLLNVISKLSVYDGGKQERYQYDYICAYRQDPLGDNMRKKRRNHC